MDTNLSIALIIILSVICLFLLYREWIHREQRIKTLEKQVIDLQKASLQRLPYASFEEILNGMAALDILERESDFKQSVIQNAKAHFANAMAVGTKREKQS